MSIALVLATLVAFLVVAAPLSFWDFRVYVRAAQDALAGRDPYVGGYYLEIGFGRAGVLPFVYPPLALLLFAPFTLLPETAAALAWLAIKLGAWTALVATWRRFVPLAVDARLGLLLVFGFNAACFTDLVTGNLAVLEALALYAAFDQLLRDRPGRFAALVLAAAAVKLQPIVFLAALVPWGGPRRLRVLAIACATAAAIAALHALVVPVWSGELVRALAGMDERRWNNPTVLALVRDLGAPDAVAIMPALAILAVTARAIAKARPEPRALVPLVFVVAALVLPRFKNYTYVELLPAAAVALRACRPPARYALAALIGVVLPYSYLLLLVRGASSRLEAALPVGREVWGYVPLAAAFAVWLVYIRALRRTS